MSHTPGRWTAEFTPFEDGTPFCRIKAGEGHHHNKKGFQLSGVLAPDDAQVLIAAPQLLAVCKAVLLFHSYETWSPEHQRAWTELTGSGDATTKALCDFTRAAIAEAEPGG